MTKKARGPNSPKCRQCKDTGALPDGLPCLVCGCGDRRAFLPKLRGRAVLTFEWEPLQTLLDEGLARIVFTHWKEVGVHKREVPLDVDWEGYQLDEDCGILKLLAARRGDKLVGYASYYVRPHRHYKSTLHAANDAIYVAKGERGAGIALIRAAETMLAQIARPEYRYIRILYHAKVAVEAERGTFARVFEHLGYPCFETTHDKVVPTGKR